MTNEIGSFAGRLRALTPARVRLDPRGGAAPLSAVLDFQASHARARDAIRQPVDWAAVKAGLGDRPLLELESRAPDRDTYLRRPDLGRRLSPESLARVPQAKPDLAVVIADGLSGFAVAHHAAAMVAALEAALPETDLGPVALVRQGRVAIGDEIAQAMGAPLCLMLIGERPGLSVSDSLGAYLTWAPRIGTPDSARNCVSNIHGKGGLSHRAAAELIAYLAGRAREIGATGVALKDERGQAALPSAE
ncbi:ethanolamine ammonia-lyase subunit EutC [Poseidonocella sp. HB161398]|uniref:ethanolamine ammonia-lyase subunit EutC n=1 Tax=Poseidonocella sp. HB161398 TaxID=2320855 RepID=UPI00110993BC|nr:ethanolamine ammonia-lyase subunit EutC [Poseidonocella sp. HB161398]